MSEQIASHEFLVCLTLRRFAGARLDREEALQVGRLALVEASRTWRPDGGSSFASWARARIYTAIRSYARGVRRNGGSEFLEEEHASAAPPAEARLERVEAVRRVARAVEAMPREDRTFLDVLVDTGRTEVAGEAIGLSYAASFVRRRRIVAELRAVAGAA